MIPAFARYADGFWRREREAEARRRERERRAGAAAREAARLLGRMGARRVVLFGSLAIEGHFREASDIDLLTEGIDPSRLEEVEGGLSRALPGFKFDIVPAECASRHLLSWVAAHGAPLDVSG